MQFSKLKAFSLALAIVSYSPNHAYAQDVEIEECKASVSGELVSMNFDLRGHWSGPNPWLFEDYTMREILLGGWGETTCPSPITLAYLAPDFTPQERRELCLVWDDKLETYTGFSNGPRDAYGTCKERRTMCERVADLKDEAKVALGIGAAATAGAGTASSVASAAGVTAVTHSSGAAILTGSSGYVAGSLGTFGATALGTITAVVTAPATLVVGAASVAVIGGTAYICWDDLTRVEQK